MTKKTWSVVLLCVLAVLLIVLCAVGFKIQKSLETLEHADASNGVIPGAGMLTLVYANLSLYFGGGEGNLLSFPRRSLGQDGSEGPLGPHSLPRQVRLPYALNHNKKPPVQGGFFLSYIFCTNSVFPLYSIKKDLYAPENTPPDALPYESTLIP